MIAESEAKMLAGLFGVCGEVGFLSLDHEPSIRYADNKEVLIEALIKKFRMGSIVYRPGSESISWLVGPEETLALTPQLKRYCPPRRSMLQAFEKWEKAGPRQKLKIAKSIESNRFEGTKIKDYQDIIDDHYATGAFIGRGSLRTKPRVLSHRPPDKPYLVVGRLQSRNKPALEAISLSYGGSVHPASHSEHSGTRLDMGEQDTWKFLDKIKAYLPPEIDMDYYLQRAFLAYRRGRTHLKLVSAASEASGIAVG